MLGAASSQQATTDSNGSCFPLEITQFAHQMTGIRLDAAHVFLLIQEIAKHIVCLERRSSKRVQSHPKMHMVCSSKI